MNRRDFYRFVDTLRHAATATSAVHVTNNIVLDAFRRAMMARRGLMARDAGDGAALVPLLQRDDVAVLLDHDDLLGRVYQALNATALEAAYRSSARDRRKFTPDEIPAVSQLFTPRWVVEFLLHNTLGRLWIELHPTTGLRKQFGWIVGESSVPGRQQDWPAGTRRLSPRKRAIDIRFLDPACGTMNFGLVAFEMLCDMYSEELDRAGEEGWPGDPSVARDGEIAAAVLRNNLFGIDIDPVALSLARASLEMKSGTSLSGGDCNLWHADALFDPKIASRCDGVFDVVATNPPYLSSRNLAADQVARMKKRFPAAWRDLYGCFIERSLDFAGQDGRIGLLAMQSFMFTGSYEKLRAQISERSAIETLAHFGPGLFGIGNPGTLQTVALVAKKEADSRRREARPCIAFRLVDVADDEKENRLREAMRDTTDAVAHDFGERIGITACGFAACLSEDAAKPQAVIPNSDATPCDIRFHIPQSALKDLPRRTWAYWIDAPLRQAFRTFPRLGDIAPPRQGLATTDNFRFVRYWWEVAPTHRDAPARATAGRWIAYAKGGQFRRWYESPRYRVNWQDDGREIKQAIIERYPYLKGQWQWVAKNTSYYGRGGVTWSYLTSGRFSARRLETGAIFDVAGSSLFPDDVPGMLAVLNSSAIHRLLGAINPTVNFQVGDLAELPVPRDIPRELAMLAESAIGIQQGIDAEDESSPDFVAPPTWVNAVERIRSRQQDLANIQNQVERIVCDLYGLTNSDPHAGAQTPMDLRELARRWVSFGIGILLGRWNASDPGRVLRLHPPDPRLVADLRDILDARMGKSAAEVEAQLGEIGSFLAKDFYPWHVRLYRRRPPYWALGDGNTLYLLAHDFATPSALNPILRKLGNSGPPDWDRCVDDGIAVGLAPWRALVPDQALRRVLDQVARDRNEGRMAWIEAGM